MILLEKITELNQTPPFQKLVYKEYNQNVRQLDVSKTSPKKSQMLFYKA